MHWAASLRGRSGSVVIAGDVNPQQALAWVGKYFDGIPKPATPVPRVTIEEPPQAGEQRLTKSYGSNSPLPAVVEGYHMPAIYSPDYYALTLAANMLSQGESSRLYRKLVYEDRIALTAAGFPLFTEQPNLFWVFAIMNQGKTVAATSDRSKELVREKPGKVGAAQAVGKLLGERAKALGVTRVVFDRAGYLYHGRVRAVAEGARAAGLEF